jgi:Na+/proline symporter
MAGLFVVALFIPFANEVGAIVGAVAGLIAAAVFAYWDVLTGGPTLSFQWVVPVALIVQLGVSCLVSVMTGRQKNV